MENRKSWLSALSLVEAGLESYAEKDYYIVALLYSYVVTRFGKVCNNIGSRRNQEGSEGG